MNTKRFISLILAIWITVIALTACSPGGTQSSQTTGSSSTQTKDPVSSAHDFAERLQNALLGEIRCETDFEIKEKHEYSSSSTMEKALFAKWKADFSDTENRRFLYSMQRNPSAEAPELLMFYDEGYFYVKDSHSCYRQPAALGQAQAGIPFDGLTALLGGSFAESFREADYTENADGSVTAEISISLETGAEAITEYLQRFGIEASGYEYGMNGDPCQIFISVCMNGDRLTSYTVETVMAGQNANREIYPVTYTVKAVYRDTENEFALTLPDAEARADYMEAEPEITEINAEEFLKRFEKSDERSGNAVYTEMITNSTATYEFSESYQVKIPILNVTAIDLSKPKAPKISVTESKLDAMGIAHKKEIYYKDDVYYYAEDGYRISMSYPAEEYLANVEASAKEKAEAGITTFFLTEQMLENAVFTVGQDQSVTAEMTFNGTLQEKNIFYHIKSIYNDDLAAMQSASLQSASLSVTLDRFNYLRSYTLTVTALIESNGKKALATYTVQYRLDYSETPREIDFPDDLDRWGVPSQDTEKA